MPEITFVFGPNHTFFFDCPKTWKFHGIPQTLRQLFNSSMGPQWRIAQPYCVALAPQINSPEPLWYAGVKTLSGEDKLFFSQTYFEANYADLARWSKSFPHAPRAAFVTFGPNLSYFACAPGHGSIWAGIPSEMEDKVRKAYDTPSCVALGQKNAWVVLYPDGYIAWKLHGHYKALEKILKEAAPRSISYVAVSPYHKEHYFIAFRDKSIRYDFTGAPSEWMKLMTEVFDAWAADRVAKQPIPQQFPNMALQGYPQQPYQPIQQPYPTPPYGQMPPPAPQQANRQSAYFPPQQAVPVANPMSPPLTPNSPLPLYTSPAMNPAVPVVPVQQVYGYQAPQGAVFEMPAEVPGAIMLQAPVDVPVRSTSTEVSNNSQVRLARDLWGSNAS